MRRLTSMMACALLACARSPELPREGVVGQWIWSREDAALFDGATAGGTGLRAAVWIGTLTRDGGGPRTQLGVSPRLVRDSTPTLLIRFDDSLHPLVDSMATAPLAEALGARIAALLEAAGPATARAAIQLDYDAPVRLLPHWAALVRELRATTLRGQSVWITSILAHVEQPQYGTWFRGVVDGHVLQLFDTRVAFTAAMQRKVERVLRDAALPYAIGIGTFERSLGDGRSTEHRAWLPWAEHAVKAGRADAVWIFAARRPWRHLLSSVGP